MKRTALFGVLMCLCSANLLAQDKGSYAQTHYSLGTLCQVSQEPTAVCPGADWVVTDASGNHIDYNGSVGASAHDEYGHLQAFTSAVVTCHDGCAEGSAESDALGQAHFADILTFPGLSASGQYYLMVSISVTGGVSGGFLTGPDSASAV